MGKNLPAHSVIPAAVTVAAFYSCVPVRADTPASLAAGTADATTQAAPAAEGSGFENNLTGDWWGRRQQLQDAGISIGSTLTLEGFANFRGGVDTAHRVGATTFDLNLTLDTEKLSRNAE
jgi:carbohydrate-selective porin OprB